VISHGDKHWFVTSEELVHYDDQSGKAQPRLEQSLTEGIANVLSESKAKACFAIGHRELSIDDVVDGPEGAYLRVRQGKGAKDRVVPLDTGRVRLSKKLRDLLQRERIRQLHRNALVRAGTFDPRHRAGL